MKKTAVLLALLGVSMVSAATLKKSIGETARKNLAQGEGHDLEGVDWEGAGIPECGCNTNPGTPPNPPNQPPTPPIGNPCPDLPETGLPEVGILTAVGSEVAAERSVEHVCYKDTACL